MLLFWPVIMAYPNHKALRASDLIVISHSGFEDNGECLQFAEAFLYDHYSTNIASCFSVQASSYQDAVDICDRTMADYERVFYPNRAVS